MPDLAPTDFYATITWLGLVPRDRGIRAEPREVLELGFYGVDGERHEGLTRPACVRTLSQHPEGTEIANVRQLTIVSAEEMAVIAEACQLERLDPAFLGASMEIEGIGDFTHVPPSSRLQGEDGVTLVIDMQNGPCNNPAREIEKDHAGHGKPFKEAARGRRGVTAWVERPGNVRVGDRLRLHVPSQRPWKLATDQ